MQLLILESISVQNYITINCKYNCHFGVFFARCEAHRQTCLCSQTSRCRLGGNFCREATSDKYEYREATLRFLAQINGWWWAGPVVQPQYTPHKSGCTWHHSVWSITLFLKFYQVPKDSGHFWTWNIYKIINRIAIISGVWGWRPEGTSFGIHFSSHQDKNLNFILMELVGGFNPFEKY